MKTAFLITLLLLSGLPAFAQAVIPSAPKELVVHTEYEKECGSPFTESQTYGFWTGKVTKIKDGNSIVFENVRSGKLREYTVHLAGIDPMGNEENLIKFLRENILGKTVEISGNRKKDSDDSFFGIVLNLDDDDYDEVNRHFLETGMAGFVKPDYLHSVSYTTMCIYEQIVAKVKKEKIGIWGLQKPAR